MFPELDQLENLDGYRQHFMDLNLWQIYVRAVCHKHGMHPCQQIRSGLAGSFPTFIVEDHWVIKFFGRLFDGGPAYEVELLVNRLLPLDLAIYAPSLLFTGNLFEDETTWGWPYLVFEYLPGTSLGEVFQQVNFEDKFDLARNLGQASRQIQRISLDNSPFFQTGRGDYARFLQEQRARCMDNHRQWQSLPGHLIDQLDSYLLPVDVLAESHVPHGLIHADITRDHILGRLKAGKWITSGLIDFGDARIGNIYYDLPALHFDLFRGDKALLRAYLEAYGWLDEEQYIHKAMTTALLHQFNIFTNLKDMVPQVHQVATLSELAKRIWDFN